MRAVALRLQSERHGDDSGVSDSSEETLPEPTPVVVVPDKDKESGKGKTKKKRSHRVVIKGVVEEVRVHPASSPTQDRVVRAVPASLSPSSVPAGQLFGSPPSRAAAPSTSVAHSASSASGGRLGASPARLQSPAAASSSPGGQFGAPPNRAASPALGRQPQGDKVSFKKSSNQEEVWALSRRKLDSLRTLSGGMANAAPMLKNNIDKSASMNLAAFVLPNRRSSTFTVPRKQQVLLLPFELVNLKRTLSDPHIKAAMVAAEDDAVSISTWMSNAGESGAIPIQGTPMGSKSEPRRGRRSSVATSGTPATSKAAKALLRALGAELQQRIPDPQGLKQAFAQREARIRLEFEAARFNPLHHLENVSGSSRKSRAKTMKLEAQQLISETAQMVAAPAAPLSMAGPPSSQPAQAAAAGGKKLMMRKDCVLEFDASQERYVLKYATCDRMVVSLVDRFWEVEKEKTRDKKGKSKRVAEVVATARQFCIGSLKLWSANEVLEAMLRLKSDLVTHSSKMQGTEWAASMDMSNLESLVRVWLQECFPRCVKDSATLSSFTELVAAMPNRDQIEEDIVQLSQSKSDMFKRAVGKKSLMKKRGLGLFAPAAPNRNSGTEFMNLNVLEVSAADMALEMTRLTVSLMREVSVDKLVAGDLSVDPTVARAAKSYLELPPLFVLRSRTERLSHWAASVVVGEKQLSRRVALFSKMIAIAARLMDMRNMHDSVAIITAMHNPAVSRLRQTTTAAGETVLSAFQRLTALIRPPYQNLRRKLTQWAEWTEKTSAFLPPLEVLLQDMQKLDEIEHNFVPHPDNAPLSLGNIWKTNLLGVWVARFCDGFANRAFDFEGSEPTGRTALIASLVRVLPDVWDDDTLWAMSQRLETSAL